MKFLFTLLFHFLCCASLWAQGAPPLINYQGRLTDETGASVVPGAYTIQFRLWSSPTSTNAEELIWAQQQNATVFSNGVFNVILGAPGGSAIPGLTTKVNDLSFAFTESDRFLGITLASHNGSPLLNPGELLPRQQIMSAPFSIYAGNGNPPGTVISYAGDGLEMETRGWLVCDGRALKRAEYPALWAAIGTRWGNGSTGVNGEPVQGFDFNLPDLRGVFLRGRSAGSLRDSDADARGANRAGGVTGNQVGSTQGDQSRVHAHGGGNHTHDHRNGAAALGAGVGGTPPGNPGPPGYAYNGNLGYAHAVPATYLIQQENVANYKIASLGIMKSGAVIQPEGGAETRPKNASVEFLIKY